MIAYIDENKARFGVEPICTLLPIAPSTYYEVRSRPPCARQLRDTELKAHIGRVHAANCDIGGTIHDGERRLVRGWKDGVAGSRRRFD
jgi:putative transposase